jgi:tetratricopeptide (TPR) repeat protein
VPRPFNRQAILRWAFFALGLFIVVRPDLLLNSTQAFAPFAQILFPNSRWGQVVLTLAITVLPMQGAVLYLITSWGLARGSRWARWTGLVGCIFLLPGFPWLTLAGLLGAGLILAIPITKPAAILNEAARNASGDYWAKARNSRAQQIVVFASGALLIPGFDGSVQLAQHIGLPEWTMGWLWWPWAFALLLVNTTIHELGHLFMAWALHQELKFIAVGPVTVTKTRYGRSVRIRWGRLFETGGYMGSVPTVKTNVRLQEIAVILAGPAASLFTGLLSLAVFLSLPGTSWERYWELIAINGVIAFDYVLVSAIPFGYTDGSMLFHLLARTQPGQLLIDGYLAARAETEADAFLGSASFDRLAQFRESLLKSTQASSFRNSTAIALSYQQLGYAQCVLGDWPAAEISLRKCLEFDAECKAHPAMAANGWTFLHYACTRRHHVPEAARVLPSALESLAEQSRGRDRIGVAVNRTMLAELHQRAGNWAESRSAAAEGLRILPRGNERLPLRILLLSAKAYSEVLLGNVDEGITAVEQALAIVRSGLIAPQNSNFAWSRVGELGHKLWRAGETKFSIILLKEAIAQLDTSGGELAAALLRIRLCGIFRSSGQFNEAQDVLTHQEGLQGVARCSYLAEKGRLHQATGKSADAIEGCKQLIALWQAEASAEPEIAAADSLYARVCFESQDAGSAERLALRALNILEPWEHIEAVRCRTTLFLLQSANAGKDARNLIAASIEQIAKDPLLTGPEKSNLCREEAVALQRNGFRDDSRAFVEAAEACSKFPAPEVQASAVAQA